MKIMSRKTAMTIIASFGAILGYLNTQFELGIDVTNFMATFSIVLLWVFFEAKADIKEAWEKIGPQMSKLKDAKFWIMLASVVLTVLNESFGWDLPINEIVGILLTIMGVLFGKDWLKLKKGEPR